MFLSISSFAQKSKRKVLEARRIQLQKDKVYINALLSNNKRKKKNLLNDVKDLNDKIKTRKKLINAITNEAKELGNEIYLNQLKINKNERELKALKKDYANMIYKSYKSKSQNSRIMFLLSSDNFFQAYKRFQYMKQYANYRKSQGENIQKKTLEIQQLNDTLKFKKEQKLTLLNSKKEEQIVIEKEKKDQVGLLAQVKKKEGKYKRQIQHFQKEERRIDAQINNIIKNAIAASNKKLGKKGSSSAEFTLTAEAKKLASKFVLNKGKLPWPVEKGYVSTYYGRQPHPIVKTATIQSNGVRITTTKGSKARAVFEGKVLAVQVMSGNKKAVLLQHGNYITVYKNLENVLVNPGDNVKTKQKLGTIFTDKITGKTILGFLLSKNTKTENPVNWIYRM
ncbi:peptidoglycan DD-metalloendopeptidase family protein [Lutibacter sp.]|uniref:murein hydrolase activator EnvC family protein n=1 Tax=Lutibacter sp. TaxID=1925666 RepID=UPI0025B9B465|nr:peptidoglycan DD-metalloendopeptidase family protein [Lutibacter sp.]